MTRVLRRATFDLDHTIKRCYVLEAYEDTDTTSATMDMDDNIFLIDAGNAEVLDNLNGNNAIRAERSTEFRRVEAIQAAEALAARRRDLIAHHAARYQDTITKVVVEDEKNYFFQARPSHGRQLVTPTDELRHRWYVFQNFRIGDPYRDLYAQLTDREMFLFNKTLTPSDCRVLPDWVKVKLAAVFQARLNAVAVGLDWLLKRRNELNVDFSQFNRQEEALAREPIRFLDEQMYVLGLEQNALQARIKTLQTY